MRYCECHSRVGDFILQISYRLAMYCLRRGCLARSGLPLWVLLLMAAGAGVEPAMPEPKSGVLPLHYPAIGNGIT